MGNLSAEYKSLFENKKYHKSFFLGLALLAFAGVVNSFLIKYIDNVQGNSVGDLILDNLPTLGLFWARTWGMALIVIVAVLLVLYKPRYFPVTLKSMGLMYITRPIFASLTQLQFQPEKIAIPENYPFFGSFLLSGKDLFFSGHVAFPFLISLIFWDNKKIRYTFISLSILSGIVVLFSKAHYSIDVFAAPFIVYGVYKITEKLFKEDFDYIKKVKTQN